MGEPLDEVYERIFRRLGEALQDRPDLLLLLDGLKLLVLKQGNVINVWTLNFIGELVDRKTTYSQKFYGPANATAQGERASAVFNSGPLPSGGEHQPTAAEQWQRDMTEIAWALTDRQDELAKKLNKLFSQLSGLPPDTNLEVLEPKIHASLPDPAERREAAGRLLEVVKHGAVAGATHALVGKVIEWVVPLFL